MSDARKMPVLDSPSNGGVGRGRGREKRREFCSNRAVGDVATLDMMSSAQTGNRKINELDW